MGPSDMGQVIALASLAQSYDTPEIIIGRVEGRR